jgi:choice-of-anchor B domain-containing protein
MALTFFISKQNTIISPENLLYNINAMLKKILLILVCLPTLMAKAQTVYPASNFTLCSVINPETNVNTYGSRYSGCWGWYQANKNREYAIAGSSSGTYWVDVTNPYQPTVCAFRPGKVTTTVWREIKTYQNYCYVVSDDTGPNSFQIFDMQYLPDSVHKVYDGVNIFRRTHALWVDGNKLYCSSVTYSNNSKSTLDVYSLATPTAPTLLRKLNQDAPFISTVHDTYANNDTVFVSCGFGGLYAFVLTPPTYSFTQVGSLTSYPSSGYNHSSALTPNRKTLVFMDEVPASLPIKIADVQNLGNMQVVATMNQFAQCTPHNPFMANDSLCFVSAYSDGLQLINIKNPAAPFLAGYFDTHPQGGGNVNNYIDDYDGQWGAYPYFPSKNIFALDQSNGIFMLKTHLFSNPSSTLAVDIEGGGSASGVGTSTGTALTDLLENGVANQIQIYPNPASDAVRIAMPVGLLSFSYSAEIVDIKGRKILSIDSSELKSGAYFKEINTAALQNGIYFLSIRLNNQIIKHSKLVIAK